MGEKMSIVQIKGDQCEAIHAELSGVDWRMTAENVDAMRYIPETVPRLENERSGSMILKFPREILGDEA